MTLETPDLVRTPLDGVTNYGCRHASIARRHRFPIKLAALCGPAPDRRANHELDHCRSHPAIISVTGAVDQVGQLTAGRLWCGTTTPPATLKQSRPLHKYRLSTSRRQRALRSDSFFSAMYGGGPSAIAKYSFRVWRMSRIGL